MFLRFTSVHSISGCSIEIEPQREIGDVQSYVDNLDKYQTGDMHMDDQSICFQLHLRKVSNESGSKRIKLFNPYNAEHIAAASSLTGVTALWPLSKTHLS